MELKRFWDVPLKGEKIIEHFKGNAIRDEKIM